MKMLLSEIAIAVAGRLSGEDLIISSVSIDTRTLSAGDLYIAINGDNFDGHHFIDQAEAAGASAVLVEHPLETRLAQIVVKDSRIALAELAGAWKNNCKAKTVAITGSNGKTTVKEMIAAILALDAKVLSTKGNLNNDIGVPLTLLELKQTDQFAVIEMGANHAGEIAYSCQYAKPDVAVINNVGEAHIEGFGSVEGVALAKAEIIQNLEDGGIAVLNKDDVFYQRWLEIAGDREVITFGLDKTADINAQAIDLTVNKDKFSTRFMLSIAAEEIEVQLNLAGQHNVLNALAATACCLSLGVGLLQIKQGLEKLKPVKGRLEPLVTQQGGLVINDSYNANPSSLKVALDVLMQCRGKPWVVLGAFGEMGPDSINTHQQMGELIKSMSVERLLTVGSDTKASVQAFGLGASFFSSKEQLIDVLKQELNGDEVLLIKGSRAQKMEHVIAALVNDTRV